MRNYRFACLVVWLATWTLPARAAVAACPVNESAAPLLQGLTPAQTSPAAHTQKKMGQATARLNLSVPSFAITAADHRMTGLVPSVCDPPPPAKFSFAPTDVQAYQWTSVPGASMGDVVKWDWIKPDGSVYVSQQLTLSFSGDACFWGGVNIAGQPPASLPGSWQVKVSYNDALILTESFTIFSVGGGSDGRLCSKNLQSFYVGDLTLGFAAVRASCSLGQILPPPVSALMVNDLNSTAIGVASLSPCLRYDASRFTDLAARVSGMTGDQALSEIQQLVPDLQQAVSQSGLSCDHGINASAVGALYAAGINLGYAASRATCHTCQLPIPPATVALISSDLANALQSLRAYAACIPSFDFGRFSNIRLGAPFTMIDSYNDLLGLYSAVQLAIANSDCCCTCSGGGGGGGGGGGTGTITGLVRNALNAQPLAGATISIANTSLSATSANDGTYTLSNVPAGQQTLNAAATGFISTQLTVTAVAGQTVTQNISLSPILQQGQTRITLNWSKDSNNHPDDLDMHLTGPNPDGSTCFHVYFNSSGSLTSAPFAQLEVDNIQVTGHPPTETIRITQFTPGIYSFYVHNYRGETPDGLSQSRATVQVFDSTGLVFSQTVPAGTGLYWNVFTLNGQTGSITLVNALSDTASSTPCR